MAIAKLDGTKFKKQTIMFLFGHHTQQVGDNA